MIPIVIVFVKMYFSLRQIGRFFANGFAKIKY